MKSMIYSFSHQIQSTRKCGASKSSRRPRAALSLGISVMHDVMFYQSHRIASVLVTLAFPIERRRNEIEVGNADRDEKRLRTHPCIDDAGRRCR
jgi:hypothetical protein